MYFLLKRFEAIKRQAFDYCLYFDRAALGEGCKGDTVFADSMEEFGGGQDDPLSVSVGGCF